jgi:hypothetical protein
MKVFILPFGVAGKLRVDLNKLPPFRLEVEDSRTIRILLNHVKVHKLLHRQVVLFTQGQRPQNHAVEESPLGFG